MLKVDASTPRLLPGSILHTDSAKAYRQVGPQAWPARGALHSRFETAERFKVHLWTHTNVTHK